MPFPISHQAEIQTQRAVNAEAHGGPAHDDTLAGNDWIAVLVRQLGLAASDRAEIDHTRYRRQLVRLIATGMDALESLDRQLVKANITLGSGK